MANGESLTITVNGKPTEARPGTMLIHLLREQGIVVPTLCHDERLTPYGGCRLCVVARRDGRGGLVPACSTPIQRGMEIETDAPEVIESRRRQLQLLVLNHRMECPVCDRTGDCRFQDLIYEYGSPEDALPFDRMRAPKDEQSRVIVRDPEKCIICGKCVRICDEIQGVAAIGLTERGFDARVSTLLERPLDCEFCGQCVNVCPVGALVARPHTSSVPAWQRSSATTTCSYCSCGCQLTVETHDGVALRVTSNEETLPNHGKLCAKGWLGWDLLEDSGRLDTPLVRREGMLEKATWAEALDAVAGAMRKSQEAGKAVLGLGSSRLTCEDAYLMQRFVRSVAGSPHVTVGPTGGVDALVDGLGQVAGRPGSTATFEQMAAAELVLVLRGDPTRTHPLVKTELVQGSRQRGQKLILAHALSGGLERHAALYLAVEPGSEEMLLHGVAAQLLRERPAAAERLQAAPGFAEWAASVAEYTAERVIAGTGITAEQFDSLVRTLDEASSVVTALVTGLGIPGDEAAVARAAAFLMSLLEGGGEGGGLLILGEKSNVQGTLAVGLHPNLLPGGRPVTDETARSMLQQKWGGALPEAAGWSTRELCGAASRGEVGLLYVVGEDPLRVWPHCNDANRALDGAGFVVVQDRFLTRTARQADVVLPVSILGDREGTLVGADGVRRRLNRVRTPLQPLPQDGQLFVELARRLGAELPQGEALDAEIDAALAAFDEAPGPLRFEAVAPPAEPKKRQGMLIDISPQLFHSGSVTRRSRQLQELAPTVAARLSPADARAIGVENGETIRVVAEERELFLRARIDRTVRQGTLLVPWASGAGKGAASLVTEPGALVTANVRKSG